MQQETWTLTITASVFAGDMDKQSVIEQAQSLLDSLLDGTDFVSVTVNDAKRDVY